MEYYATKFEEPTYKLCEPIGYKTVIAKKKKKKKVSILHFYLMHEYLYFHKLFPDRSLCLLLFEHATFDSERQIQKYRGENKFD